MRWEFKEKFVQNRCFAMENALKYEYFMITFVFKT